MITRAAEAGSTDAATSPAARPAQRSGDCVPHLVETASGVFPQVVVPEQLGPGDHAATQELVVVAPVGADLQLAGGEVDQVLCAGAGSAGRLPRP